MHAKQTGFTIVELVVVILLLGILAATALPRFINLDQEAHAAAVEGVTGGLQTGVSLFHAQWIADGAPGADTAIPEFGNLRVNALGFPYGTADNSPPGTSDVETSADCLAVFANVLQGGSPTMGTSPDAAGVVGQTTDFVAVEVAPNCTYYYVAQNNTSGSTVPLLTYASATGIITPGSAVLP